MRVVQLSDPHVSLPGSAIDRTCDTAACLARAVEHTIRLAPDRVIVTGDLVDRGDPEEYARLREILAPLPVPVHVIPGNHDERGALVEAMGDDRLPRSGFVQYTVDDGPVRLVALDTIVPREPGGELCAERLAWLDERLHEAPDQPTIVFMHHPPFATGLQAMDAMGLRNPHGFAAVVAKHPQVERVVAGHVHRAIVRRFAGTIAFTCPSTAHQLALDLGPGRWITAVLAPPAVLVHTWSEAAGMVTHLDPVGTFPVVPPP